MHIGELPMIIFTTVAQMSVGAFWILGIIQLLGRRAGIEKSTIDSLTNAGMYAAGPLLLLGFFAAFFHLNDPFHAPFTLLHLGSSWLSRELISGVLYALFGLIFALTQWFDRFSRTVRDVFAALTALAGLSLVVSMCGVYYFAMTVPAWHTWFVWVSFFCSAFFTGSLAVALALLTTWRMKLRGASEKHGEPRNIWQKLVATLRRGLFPPGKLPEGLIDLTKRSMRITTGIAAAAGLIILVSYAFFMTQLGLGSPVQQQVARNMMAHGYLIIRLVLLVITILLIALVLRNYISRTSYPQRSLVITLWVTFVLAVATELIGRGLHYEGLVRTGINTLMG